MRRGLIAIALGAGFLVLMLVVGTLIANINPPPHSTAQQQSAQAGPYVVTLQVEPNPPTPSRPATLSLQIVQGSAQTPLEGARVTLQASMEEMDMGLAPVEASAQGNGLYRARLLFSMSGPWRLQVLIAHPGTAAASAQFEITAQ